MRVPEIHGSASASTKVANSPPARSAAKSSPAPAPTPHTIPKKPGRSPSSDFVPVQSEWIVECDDCGRKHKPDEKLMGKRIRCKCGTVLHLTEHPNAGIPLAPLESEMVDLSQLQPYDTAAGPAPVFQAPPPNFKSSATSISEQRKREAEEMVRAADEQQQWQSTLKEEDDDGEWGPLGKIIGGVAMMVGGAIWFVLGMQEGYLYFGSVYLMGGGLLSAGFGLFETYG